MTSTNRSKIWLGVVPFFALLLAAACSSSGNNNNSSRNSNNNAQPAASIAASGQAGSGAPLSDCAYSAKVLQVFAPITTALAQQDLSGTPGPGGADANLGKTLDTLATALKQSAASLQAVTPPADFKAFQETFVTALQTTAAQVNDAKTAFAAGDLSKATNLFASGADSFGSEFDKLQQQYPALTARIDACSTATP